MPIARPVQLDKILQLAEKLATNQDFIAITFLDMQAADPKFLNASFSPDGGYANWKPADANYRLGELWPNL